jgi:hypothetical protein
MRQRCLGLDDSWAWRLVPQKRPCAAGDGISNKVAGVVEVLYGLVEIDDGMPLRSVKMYFFIRGPSAGSASEVDARLQGDFMLTGAANILLALNEACRTCGGSH